MLFLLASCQASPYAKIDGFAKDGDFDDAIALHQKNTNRLYDKKSMLLYQLDSGMLNHYAGNNDASLELLQAGEISIEEAYTKSIAESVAFFFSHSSKVTYPGEDYEDVYISLFNILNFQQLGDYDAAMVEIRRLTEKLAFIQVKYDILASQEEEYYRKTVSVTNARKETRDRGVSMTYRRFIYKSALNDSALGRYLGMLFYRAADRPDDVRIDYNLMENIFLSAVRLYDQPIPASVKEELDVRSEDARLNIVSFSGMAPIKEAGKLTVKTEQTLFRYVAGPKAKYKNKLPIPLERPSIVNRIEVVFANGRKCEMELLEDMGAVQSRLIEYNAEMIVKESRSRERLKSLVKFMFLGYLAPFVNTDPKPDIRASHYFPGRTHVAGVTLEPGIYSFHVNYYDIRGEQIESVPFRDVKVEAGKVNLFEAFCLK